MANVNQRVGEYVLQSKINSGTFGEVWKAHHHVWIDQLVAVKIPTDPQFLQNLQREGVAIHGLTHPNIVHAMGFDPYAEIPYLTMEYVPGSSLRPLIQKRNLSIPDAVAIMRQVLLGLNYAHSQNIVHRDIKPENILVHERGFQEGFGTEGVIKVTDFGLGKAIVTTTMGSIAYSQSMDTPAAREIAGTLDYMSPEQRSGAEVDRRADLYACGVVLYELLTGERPAGTDLPSDINRNVPKSLDEAFRRSYARLDKRFASATDFLAALAPTMPPLLPRQKVDVNRAIPGVGIAGHSADLPMNAVRPPCPQCRHPVEADDQFCMQCGMQLVENIRRCPMCGAYPDATDQYCIFCGQTLTAHLTRV
ncbi:MAG TPA: serine/threonine-protein kinase [Tepidisphaeraceae bacterium]|jgi:serine/threonine protein kinase|nr:serine/threonine-protein kinase [Tepidisphaeraceae bacterium]